MLLFPETDCFALQKRRFCRARRAVLQHWNVDFAKCWVLDDCAIVTVAKIVYNIAVAFNVMNEETATWGCPCCGVLMVECPSRFCSAKVLLFKRKFVGVRIFADRDGVAFVHFPDKN